MWESWFQLYNPYVSKYVKYKFKEREIQSLQSIMYILMDCRLWNQVVKNILKLRWILGNKFLKEFWENDFKMFKRWLN